MSEKMPNGIPHLEIASEIGAMYELDQAMREQRIADKESWDDGVDRKNTERMKEIIAQIGWPTKSKVGPQQSRNAWLLVQHADHDVTFQEMCLNLMKNEPQGEVETKDIVYLEDRVRVNKGEQQLYGTQFRVVEGKRVPKTIEDPEHVNERRKEIGPGTLEDYTKQMYEKYGEPDENEK